MAMIYDAVQSNQSMDGCCVECDMCGVRAVSVVACSVRCLERWRAGSCFVESNSSRRLERNGNPGLPPWLPPWLPPLPDTGTGISGHHCLLPGLGWAGLGCAGLGECHNNFLQFQQIPASSETRSRLTRLCWNVSLV